MKTDNRLTWKEFCDITEVMTRCSRCALSESQADASRLSEFSNRSIGNGMIDILMACYKRSAFALQNNEEYSQYIKAQFTDIVEVLIPRFRDRDRMRIMIPVIFYSLILQNERNEATVIRRANKMRISGNEPMTKWQQRNPYKVCRDTFRPPKDSNKLFAAIEALNAHDQMGAFYTHQFFSNDAKRAVEQIHHLKANMHYVEYLDFMAKAGLFLRDILEHTHTTGKPLDTIIRMYCIMDLNDVLNGCRLISDKDCMIMVDGKNEFKDYDSGDIIMEYALEQMGYGLYSSMAPDAKYRFPVIHRKAQLSSAPHEIKKDLPRLDFGSCYAFLTNHYNFDSTALFDYLLNRETLEGYLDAGNAVRNYLKIQHNILQYMSRITKEGFDLNTVLHTLEFIKEKQNVLAVQTNISKHQYEEEQELKQSEQEMEEQDFFLKKHGIDKDDWDWFFDSDDDEDIYEDVEFWQHFNSRHGSKDDA